VTLGGVSDSESKSRHLGMNNPGKKQFVQQIFSDISPQYDRLNRLMSLSLDQRWRRRVARDLVQAQLVIDLCAGTGDMSLALLENPQFRGEIMLVDFNQDMLNLARKKIEQRGFGQRVSYQTSDVEKLPFPDNAFDGAVQGFALRNLENLDRFFSETLRILKPGKSAAFLEIAHPENKAFQKLFYFYFYSLLPKVTTLVTGNGQAYRWLPQSLKEFPPQGEVVEQMRKAGFKNTGYQNWTGGMVACYRGVK